RPGLARLPASRGGESGAERGRQRRPAHRGMGPPGAGRGRQGAGKSVNAEYFGQTACRAACVGALEATRDAPWDEWAGSQSGQLTCPGAYDLASRAMVDVRFCPTLVIGVRA